MRLDGTRRGEGTHDDHRHGTVFHDEFEERDAVHARHLNIQRDHIGRQFQNLVPGRIRVRGCADNFDVGKRGQTAGDDLARQRGVIDHQKTNGSGAHDVVRIKPVAFFQSGVCFENQGRRFPSG